MRNENKMSYRTTVIPVVGVVIGTGIVLVVLTISVVTGRVISHPEYGKETA